MHFWKNIFLNHLLFLLYIFYIFLRANITATAAALASKLLNKPVRVALGLNTSMSMIGKRFPWYAKYKIGFDQTGKLLGIIINWYCDSGNSPNGNFIYFHMIIHANS